MINDNINFFTIKNNTILTKNITLEVKYSYVM